MLHRKQEYERKFRKSPDGENIFQTWLTLEAKMTKCHQKDQ